MHQSLRPLALAAGALLLAAPAWAQTTGTSGTGSTSGTTSTTTSTSTANDPHSRHDVGKVVAVNVSGGTLSIQTQSQGVVTYKIGENVQVSGDGTSLDDVNVGDEVRVDYAVYGNDRTVSRVQIAGTGGTRPVSTDRPVMGERPGSTSAGSAMTGTTGTSGSATTGSTTPGTTGTTGSTYGTGSGTAGTTGTTGSTYGTGSGTTGTAGTTGTTGSAWGSTSTGTTSTGTTRSGAAATSYDDDDDELPATSTFFPAFGLAGALSLLAAGALALRRRR